MSRRRKSAPAPSRQANYTRIKNTLPKARVFSDDEVQSIHDTSLRVLSELGIKVLLPEGREIYRAAGATVKDDMVYLDPAMVEDLVAKAPSEFTLKGGSEIRDIPMGGDWLTFGPSGGCPNCTDLDRGRRPGTMQDFEDLIRLTQAFDIIPKLSQSVEPQDVPTHLRHYGTNRAQLVLSDKVPFVFARGRAQTQDGMEMLALGRGVSLDDLPKTPFCTTVINTNSPRQLDIPMTMGLIDFARWGQVCVVTPFCLAGAMAPITIPGALTLSHAEALAGIALTQIVNPGVPVIYGAFSSNVDMKSGAPAFGTPEHFKTNIGAGQLARHVNLPWRSGAGSASNAPDAQGAYENLMGLMGAILGGSHIIYHATGWLEGGLTCSFEKFITDIEVCQGLAESMLGVPAGPDDIGFKAIKEVQPGGHFFDAVQTMERYRTAFYEPFVSDLRNFGQWSEAGAPDTTQRANVIWKQTLAEFTPPPVDPARVEAIDAFIAKRTEAGGAPIAA